MKNRKWVLGILLFLIVCVLAFLVLVLAVGSNMYNKEQKYYNELENAACDYVQDENVTKDIWENFTRWQKIYISTLIDNNYVKANSVNPATKQKAINNKNGYVKIEFNNNKIICKYNEE